MAESRARVRASGEGRPRARPRTRPRVGRGAGAAEKVPVRGDGLGELAAATAEQHPVCTVAFCPICLVVTAVGDARPDLIEHLMTAGRELLLAARAVIDSRLETMEERPTTGLERISIE